MATFYEKPFSVVDSLVLSQLCYMHTGGIVPAIEDNGETVTVLSLYRAECFDEIFGGIRVPEKNRRLLYAMCASPRFRSVGINYFTETIDDVLEKQFCAVTFFLPTGETYVCYRGTDATITGWKEDFNLFFDDVIPGHSSALHYLEIVAARTTGKLDAGGHSKGGHLALYGATFAPQPVQERIVSVFNHDGPGLSKYILNMPGYTDISGKVNTTLPQSSLFGLIFSDGSYNVVKSTRLGIMQHDPFSWEIRNGDFVYTDKITGRSGKIAQAVNEIIETLPEEDSEIFIETVFDIFRFSEAESFKQLPEKVFSDTDAFAAKLKSVDPAAADKVKDIMTEIVKTLFRSIINLPHLPDKEAIKTEIQQKIEEHFNLKDR